MWSNYLDYLINFVGTPTCLFTFQGSQQEPLASSKRSSGCASGLMESQPRECLIPKQVHMDKDDKVRINDDWWQTANVLYSIELYTYSIHVKINFDSHKSGWSEQSSHDFSSFWIPKKQLRFNHPTFSTPIWGFLPSDWCPVDGPWTWIDLGVWAADVTPSACGIPIKRIRQEAGRYANSIQRHNIANYEEK